MNKGVRVTWRGLNRDYSGVVVRMEGTHAVVQVDGTGRYILLQQQNNNKKADKDGGPGGSPGE